MLSKQHNSTIKSGEPVVSSQLNLDHLHSAIKQTYFELDKDLRKIVKDDSGCVCVSISSFFGKEIFYLCLDNLSDWSRNDLFN
jgi:hypothetical protein